MNSPSHSMPGLRTLYWRDLIIRRSVNMIIGGVLGAVGILWATKPATAPPPGVDLSFELAAALWAPVGGAVLSGLGGIILVWRYLLVRKVLTQGTTIKGLVADLEVVSSTPERHSTSTVRRASRHAYFATVRYTVHGVEREVCLRLPNSGFVYGLIKGRETDLIVLDWAPDKPLIRSVYLGRL